MKSRNFILVVAIGSLAATLLHGIASAIQASKRGTIYYVPSAHRVGLATPGKYSDPHVLAFARMYATNYDTYTLATVKGQSEEILRYVSPAATTAAIDALTERLRRVNEGSYASVFILKTEETLIEETPRYWKVELPGYKYIFASDYHVTTYQGKHILYLVPGVPTSANPYGLYVESHDLAFQRVEPNHLEQMERERLERTLKQATPEVPNRLPVSEGTAR
jgi:hypothetical protein